MYVGGTLRALRVGLGLGFFLAPVVDGRRVLPRNLHLLVPRIDAIVRDLVCDVVLAEIRSREHAKVDGSGGLHLERFLAHDEAGSFGFLDGLNSVNVDIIQELQGGTPTTCKRIKDPNRKEEILCVITLTGTRKRALTCGPPDGGPSWTCAPVHIHVVWMKFQT